MPSFPLRRWKCRGRLLEKPLMNQKVDMFEDLRILRKSLVKYRYTHVKHRFYYDLPAIAGGYKTLHKAMWSFMLNVPYESGELRLDR